MKKPRNFRRQPSLYALPMNTEPEQRAMKLFTIPEANALLPSVRTIVGKIQRAHRNVSGYRDEARKAAEGAEKGGGGMPAGVNYAQALVVLTGKITELEALG